MLYSRAIHAQRLDAEYGLGGVGMRSMGMRDAGPLLMIGGCTCLVVRFLDVCHSVSMFLIKSHRLQLFLVHQ